MSRCTQQGRRISTCGGSKHELEVNITELFFEQGLVIKQLIKSSSMRG